MEFTVLGSPVSVSTRPRVQGTTEAFLFLPDRGPENQEEKDRYYWNAIGHGGHGKASAVGARTAGAFLEITPRS